MMTHLLCTKFSQFRCTFFHILLIYSTFHPVCCLSNSPEYDAVNSEVSNWKDEALANLLIQDNVSGERKVRESDLKEFSKQLRCIKLNNPCCLKDVGWLGRIGSDGAGHTAFSYMKYSARALTRDLRTKYTRHKLKSAWEIVSKYAPPDNCVGDITNPNGSCRYGKNPTREYAEFIIRGVTNSIHNDLHLFDEIGNHGNNLALIIKNITNFECAPFSMQLKTVTEGIKLESIIKE